LTIGYAATIGGIVVVRRDHVDEWQAIVAGHVAFVAVAVLLIRGAERWPELRVLGIARLFYPAVAFLLGYAELDRLHALIVPEDWLTKHLLAADLAVFGVHPTVWVQRWYGSWADELLAMCYLSYYLLGLGVTVPWLLRGHRELVFAAGASAGLTYFVNYALFYLLPAEGPRFLAELAPLHHSHFHGPVFASLCDHLLGDAGVIRGGCFPSSHVSGATAFSLTCARYGWRGQTWVIAGLSIGLTLATVYLGYHHGVDPLGGVVMGIAGYAVGVWWLRRRGEDPVSVRAGRQGPRGVGGPASRSSGRRAPYSDHVRANRA
jgi:membrane-associated phospholipid phosphatase